LRLGTTAPTLGHSHWKASHADKCVSILVLPLPPSLPTTFGLPPSLP
jgi:hypothetical protein